MAKIALRSRVLRVIVTNKQPRKTAFLRHNARIQVNVIKGLDK